MPPDADVGTPSPGWLIPKPARPLTGQERFSSDPSSVLDFWRWAFSDLRTNIVRGVLDCQGVAERKQARSKYGSQRKKAAAPGAKKK